MNENLYDENFGITQKFINFLIYSYWSLLIWSNFSFSLEKQEKQMACFFYQLSVQVETDDVDR